MAIILQTVILLYTNTIGLPHNPIGGLIYGQINQDGTIVNSYKIKRVSDTVFKLEDDTEQ